MSKMGQELEKRLDENKYEMYGALEKIAVLLANPLTTRQEATYSLRQTRAIDEAWQLAREVITKIEGDK